MDSAGRGPIRFRRVIPTRNLINYDRTTGPVITFR